MEKCFFDSFIIDDIDVINERFLALKGVLPDWDAIDDYLAGKADKNIYYFDSLLKKMQPDDKGIMYAWIDTGYSLGENNPLFISLVNFDGYYCGHFLGTGQYLMNGMCRKNPYQLRKIKDNYAAFCVKYQKLTINQEGSDRLDNKTIEVKVTVAPAAITKESSKGNVLVDEAFPKQHTDVTQEIYDSLLYPNWKTIEGLDTYLKVIGRRLTQLIEQEKTEYYVLNNIKSVIVNTGLMDQFGTDYLVMYKYHMNKPYYVASRVIHGKLDYLEERFSREQSNIVLKPITFFDDDQQQWFDATLEDLDINTRCLQHVVERSIERLPSIFKGMSMDRITRTLLNAIELGFRFQEKDKYCAKAIYSGGKISWLFPFRVNKNYNEEPEMVIVISKSREFYEVKTILPYDDEMKDKITALSLYHQWW